VIAHTVVSERVDPNRWFSATTAAATASHDNSCLEHANVAFTRASIATQTQEASNCKAFIEGPKTNGKTSGRAISGATRKLRLCCLPRFIAVAVPEEAFIKQFCQRNCLELEPLDHSALELPSSPVTY
jgi:hypothetical protein